MIYTEFAKFYDDLFDATLYERWAAYVVRQAGIIGKENNELKILDLACGTGRLAIKLAQMGFQVTGADLSEDMLTIAEQRSREADVEVPFIQTDMRSMDGLDQYDIVTCFDDSLNYLIDQNDLLAAFKAVNKHLNPRGQFMFDMITPYQVTEVYPGYMYNYRSEDAAFMWTSYEGDFAPMAVEHELNFFQYNEDKDAYDAYNEIHRERAYEHEEIDKMLDQAGFSGTTPRTDFGEKPFTDETKRWFFSTHKN
ncbi:dTDP-3-amino-3,6-dideoxy-alpha-D-glucopyranose N,N-dimethyltransferase [Lentilactobacillus sunkii]|jgi:ubiquinone/menaquinone biosynthesis C-methylase UbiE|uniref:dTDP-3-amino-3,6-dideoxy-alpha-D-glucopyranose N,N-dimethyltransferase n=1 Tax=Lentilactobacillus sunkii TaxID=481719 RepID=A0A1E7XC99_9LACO|nr:class I SAM-dependent methyltransferase [Lentilactobacillus sunkii]OFA10679.1 dTDP-3-amino-3,6-dideoxy-alpha-D-glucopyranose N,N-dimethyltransferase [Lentilactobacillus sunkii]